MQILGQMAVARATTMRAPATLVEARQQSTLVQIISHVLQQMMEETMEVLR